MGINLPIDMEGSAQTISLLYASPWSPPPHGVWADFLPGRRGTYNPPFKSHPFWNYGGLMNRHPRTDQLSPMVKGSERAKQISAMGNAAKKKLNAERKKNKEELDTLLKISLKRGDILTPDDVLSLEEAEEANIPVQTAINIAMIKRALLGDVQAALYIRDTVGEKPTDKLELDSSLSIESWAKKHKVKL